MTQAVIRPRLTFEEYIDFCSQTNDRFELVRGELVRVNPPTWLHIKIAKFLEQTFDAAIAELGRDWEAFRDSGQRTENDSSRLPDVIVAPAAEIELFLNQTAVLQVPAVLVVEIVSRSSTGEDYTTKLKEYQALQIPEYWVIDHEALGAAKYIGFPKAPTITIYTLEDGGYKSNQFKAPDLINSPTFPNVRLTAETIFRAGK
jgi:Uma2 family endonuclease